MKNHNRYLSDHHFLTRFFKSSILVLQCFSISSLLHAQSGSLTIAVSKNSPNYTDWLHRTDSSLTIKDLYPLTVAEALKVLESADGLLLTGGEDLFPGYYGKESDAVRCGEINRHRDTLDMALIHHALGKNIPIMAICRGTQVLNVALGGTLIVDIPADVPGHIVHRCEDYLHCFHPVQVLPGTILRRLVNQNEGNVTTNHHQAIDKLAPLLKVSSNSSDGIIESVEWKEPMGKSFLLGVQWHPERMEKSNALSGKLSSVFLLSSGIYHQRRVK